MPGRARVPVMSVPVVFAVDEAMLPHLAVAVTAIIANCLPATRYQFHVLFGGTDRRQAEAFERLPVGCHSIAVHVAGNPFGDPALLRLLIADTLPDLDRCIYLDADTLVLRDLSALHATELGDNILAAVPDVCVKALVEAGHDGLTHYFQTVLNHNPTVVPYINSGIMVLDLDRLRQRRFVGEALALWQARRHELLYRDQCLINFALKGRIGLVDWRWNATAHSIHMDDCGAPATREAIRLQRQDPYIVHFCGDKPWSSPAELWKGDLWWHYARLSPVQWSEWRGVKARRLAVSLYRRLPAALRQRLRPLAKALYRAAGLPRPDGAITGARPRP